MKQERISIEALAGFLNEKLDFKNWLQKTQ